MSHLNTAYALGCQYAREAFEKQAASVGDITSAIPLILPGNQIISGLDAPHGHRLSTFGRGLGGEVGGAVLGALPGIAAHSPGLKALGVLAGASLGGHMGRESAKKNWPLIHRLVRD